MQYSWTRNFEARARRHVVTALHMAGVSLAGGRPTDIEVHDRRFFAFIYHHGDEGMEQAERLGWWTCRSPPRLYARLQLARHNGGECWSLKGPSITPPVVQAA